MKKLFFITLAFFISAACGNPQNPAQPPPSQGGGSVNAPGGGGGGDDSGGTGGGSGDGVTGDAVSFVTFGDWGTGNDDQKAVAAALKNYCGTETCEFVVTLGDNFYPNGVSSTSDEQWKEKYTDIYAGLNIPFYASLGNHDENGSVEAQINYSSVDPSWHMPAGQYSFTMPEGGEPIIEFFIIRSQYPHFRETAAQGWLMSAIDASRAKWKILVMHHPLINNGKHGDDDQDNGEFLTPIICSKIDLIFSGHAHSFSHLRAKVDGCPIEQLIVGTGGAGLKSVDTADPRVIATKSMLGFGWVSVSASEAEFRMIAADGSVYYWTEWQK